MANFYMHSSRGGLTKIDEESAVRVATRCDVFVTADCYDENEINSGNDYFLVNHFGHYLFTHIVKKHKTFLAGFDSPSNAIEYIKLLIGD